MPAVTMWDIFCLPRTGVLKENRKQKFNHFDGKSYRVVIYILINLWCIERNNVDPEQGCKTSLKPNTLLVLSPQSALNFYAHS